jgi:hypothetical protein
VLNPSRHHRHPNVRSEARTMLPSFPHTHVASKLSWQNYSATVHGRSIPIYCIPEGGTTIDVLKMHGDAIRSILGYCFAQDPPAPMRALGSTWSFSKVIEPPRVVIDPVNLSWVMRVPREHYTASYQARAAALDLTPMFAEGGATISLVNRVLGRDYQLALQTSGAGDGHRIAGCIATGTHGSALGIGALHDTVLAMYLVVAPDQALFVQRGTDPVFTDGAAAWLQQQTGIPTRNVPDDRLFHAAQVSLGSLGFVFGVVVEATKLYRFRIRRSMHRADNPRVLQAIRDLNTAPLHPDIAKAPYHFEVIMHPYPHGDAPGLFVTLMWKESADGVEFASPPPGIPRTASDRMNLIARIAQNFGGALNAITLTLLQTFISEQLSSDCAPPESFHFPGEVFGPTTLPAGTGASTEIVVDHKQAPAAIETIFEVINAQRRLGNFLLGCVAARFVPKTTALLGMNQFERNCFIELPSIRNHDVLDIYEEIWKALDRKGIVFTCHWGQLGGFSPERTQRYFGNKAADWKNARRALLGSDAALHVFGSNILSQAGLHG